MQLLDEAVERTRDVAKLRAHRRQVISEIAIAGAQVFGGSQHLAQWFDDTARDGDSEADRQDHGERAATNQNRVSKRSRFFSRCGPLFQQALLDLSDLLEDGAHAVHALLAAGLALERNDIRHGRIAGGHFAPQADRGLDGMRQPILLSGAQYL